MTFMNRINEQRRKCSVRTFQKAWHELCPFITLGMPATDLCRTCQTLSVKLGQGGPMYGEENYETLKNNERHIDFKNPEKTIQESVSRKQGNFLRTLN